MHSSKLQLLVSEFLTKMFDVGDFSVPTFGNWVLKAEWLSDLWNYTYFFQNAIKHDYVCFELLHTFSRKLGAGAWCVAVGAERISSSVDSSTSQQRREMWSRYPSNGPATVTSTPDHRHHCRRRPQPYSAVSVHLCCLLLLLNQPNKTFHCLIITTLKTQLT